MDECTACQRWGSRDKRPESMFHEMLAIPTLMPEATRPYELPGMQPGTSSMDQFPWAQDYLWSLCSAHGSHSEPEHESMVAPPSPAPPAQRMAELEQTPTPPTNGTTQREPPAPESQSQQSPASDPPSEIIVSHPYT